MEPLVLLSLSVLPSGLCEVVNADIHCYIIYGSCKLESWFSDAVGK